MTVLIAVSHIPFVILHVYLTRRFQALPLLVFPEDMALQIFRYEKLDLGVTSLPGRY